MEGKKKKKRGKGKEYVKCMLELNGQAKNNGDLNNKVFKGQNQEYDRNRVESVNAVEKIRGRHNL